MLFRSRSSQLRRGLLLCSNSSSSQRACCASRLLGGVRVTRARRTSTRSSCSSRPSPARTAASAHAKKGQPSLALDCALFLLIALSQWLHVHHMLAGSRSSLGSARGLSRSAQCKKAWCWQCGKSDHHVWECNRPAYDSSGSANDKDDLNRYLFYFER